MVKNKNLITKQMTFLDKHLLTFVNAIVRLKAKTQFASLFFCFLQHLCTMSQTKQKVQLILHLFCMCDSDLGYFGLLWWCHAHSLYCMLLCSPAV